jgi:hypothetical protein
MTGYPTVASTTIPKIPLIDSPTNDLCASATALNFDSPLNHTTALALIDEVEGCGTISGRNSPGVWYSVTGTGGALAVTVASDYNAQVSLYTGEACESLFCVDGRTGEDPRLTSVTLVWDSNEGTDYWILVHGFNQDAGNFQVVVSEVGRPGNDACSSATELELGDTATGSANYSSLDGIVDSCASDNNGSAPGVWYYVRGTGNDTIKAMVVTGFDAQLSVFGGRDCSSLLCIHSSERESPLNTSGSVTWASRAGEVYYILLRGFNRFVGNFELTLTEGSTEGTAMPSAGPAPSNDACQDAIPIQNGQNIKGSTLLASRDESAYTSENCGEYVSLCYFFIPCVCVQDTFSHPLAFYFALCRASNITGPGIWYSIVDPGGLREFLLFSDYDTQITIYSGDCQMLKCVNGNYESPAVDNTASTTLTTFLESNETYLVLVHGRNGAVGDFSLKVASVDTSPNDSCIGAIGLEPGVMLHGSTVNAVGDNAEPCGK